MTFRDRIIELIRVPAAQLQPNPRNWRTHSKAQRAALAGLLSEIGYAGAVLARRATDGKLQLIDGHLRVETSADQLVPVLVVDVDEAEADKLLATFDTLTGMAGTDPVKLRELLARIDVTDPVVKAIFQQLKTDAENAPAATGSCEEVDIPPAYQVLVECRDEREQQTVYEELTASGLDCRLMML